MGVYVAVSNKAGAPVKVRFKRSDMNSWTDWKTLTDNSEGETVAQKKDHPPAVDGQIDFGGGTTQDFRVQSGRNAMGSPTGSLTIDGAGRPNDWTGETHGVSYATTYSQDKGHWQNNWHIDITKFGSNQSVAASGDVSYNGIPGTASGQLGSDFYAPAGDINVTWTMPVIDDGRVAVSGAKLTAAGTGPGSAVTLEGDFWVSWDNLSAHGVLSGTIIQQSGASLTAEFKNQSVQFEHSSGAKLPLTFVDLKLSK